MPKTALSEARVKALAPRKSAYDIRDAALKGFGVRVLPSGAKRFFVHAQHQGRRVWKTVGDADAVTVGEARSRATSLLAEIRPAANTADSAQTTRFDLVAEAVFQRYVRVWKPHTHYVNRSYLRCHLLPTFSGRHIADITHQDVRLWFASLRTTPVAADRSLPVLSVILKEAEPPRLPPRRIQPLPGHTTLPAHGARTLSHRRRNRPPRGSLVVIRSTTAVRSRRSPLASAHRMSQERDPDPALDRLPGRAPVSARFQDGTEDCVAVERRP